MTLAAKLYIPKPWTAISFELRKRFNDVDKKLETIYTSDQVTYEELDNFRVPLLKQVRIRKGLSEALSSRPRRSYSMTQEVAGFRQAVESFLYNSNHRLYDVASSVRSLLFGKSEELRKFNMTITYHNWMVILPPAAKDPVFRPISDFCDGPPLYGALMMYLVLLTSHPFSDGNGRASRLMFNLHLAAAHKDRRHYIPLSDITRATGGIYEELIASACQHGNFTQLIWHMLHLIEAYSNFVQSRENRAVMSDLNEVLAILSGAHRRGDVNDTPPYPLSVSNLVVNCSDGKVSRTFLQMLLELTAMISEHGQILFAVTSLADVLSNAEGASGRVIFFVESAQKNTLQMRAREIRSQLGRRGDRVSLHIVVTSNNRVLDAKLLLALAPPIPAPGMSKFSCAVLLHDFPSREADYDGLTAS